MVVGWTPRIKRLLKVWNRSCWLQRTIAKSVDEPVGLQACKQFSQPRWLGNGCQIRLPFRDSSIPNRRIHPASAS